MIHTLLDKLLGFGGMLLLTLRYVPTTLLMAFSALLLGFLLGTGIALARVYRIPVLHRLLAVYVSFIRGTPPIVQLFLVYFGLPRLLEGSFGLNLTGVPSLVFAIIAFTLNAAAYLSETIRASIAALDPGQLETARAFGFTERQAMLRIVLPQAYANAIPVFGNNAITLLRSTALAFSISVLDITGGSIAGAAQSMRLMEAYLSSAVVYILLCALISRGFRRLEKLRSRYQSLQT